MKRHALTLASLLLPLLVPACAHEERHASTTAGTASRPAGGDCAGPAVRATRFTYEVAVPEVPAGTRELKVWIPMAREEEGVQEVLDQRLAAPPGALVSEGRTTVEDNRFWVVTVPEPKGPITLAATIDVRRLELKRHDFRGVGASPLSPEERTALAPYLKPDELVPVGGRFAAMAQAADTRDGNSVNRARSFYDDVLRRMRYGKEGTGWGRGSSEWACDSGYGNCTDFHSLFMSLARTEGIPARFTMGFPLPPERGQGTVGGYHCWAEFYAPETGWVPVDISEADKHPELAQYYFGALTEDRISFTRGRDLELSPAPASGRQNFFIYPIVEADGKALAHERRFAYQDL